MKLPKVVIKEIRKKYEETDITQQELAFEYEISISTLKRYVRGIRRLHSGAGHVSLDILSQSGIQVDQDKKVYGLKSPFFYAPHDLLPRQSSIEKRAHVECPHCEQKFLARNLVRH